MPPLRAWLRPWPYIAGGALFGFLFLAELALITIPTIQVGLLALALAGVAGALLRRRSLELWPLFVTAAMISPLVVDLRVVGLPRCPAVAPSVACFAGTRDLAGQFAMEVLITASAAVGVVALTARSIIDVGR